MKYEQEYHRARHGAFTRDGKRFEFAAAVAARKFGPHIQGRTLEVGCGVGRNLAAFGTAIGCDVSSYALGVARVNLPNPLVRANANPLPFADDTFDTVLLAHVLEHMTHPLEVCRELHRVLQPGGRLVVALPLPEYRSAPVDNHLHVWGEPELRNLLAHARFSVEHQQRVGHRAQGALSRLPGPLGMRVSLSRVLGSVAGVLGVRSGPMEFITVATAH